MELFNHDTKILSEKLTQNHGSKLSSLACLSYLAHDYLHRVQQEHGNDMAPILSVLTQAMTYWSVAIGYTRAQYQAAIDELEQTMTTAAHLAACTPGIASGSMPDHTTTTTTSKKAAGATMRGR